MFDFFGEEYETVGLSIQSHNVCVAEEELQQQYNRTSHPKHQTHFLWVNLFDVSANATFLTPIATKVGKESTGNHQQVYFDCIFAFEECWSHGNSDFRVVKMKIIQYFTLSFFKSSFCNFVLKTLFNI